MNISMEFSDWLTRKYVSWRGEATGHDRSISEFAEWVGVSQPLMSAWMKQKGKTPRSPKTINKLVEKFGGEVYDVLGLASPGETDIHQLPTRLRAKVDQYRVMELMGHKDPRVLRHYLKWVVADLEAAHQQGSPADQLRAL